MLLLLGVPGRRLGSALVRLTSGTVSRAGGALLALRSGTRRREGGADLLAGRLLYAPALAGRGSAAAAEALGGRLLAALPSLPAPTPASLCGADTGRLQFSGGSGRNSQEQAAPCLAASCAPLGCWRLSGLLPACLQPAAPLPAC
jgi:hypothetical protein